MRLDDWLRRQWASILREALTNAQNYRYLSPALYVQYEAVIPLMAKYLHGRVIDLGCGEMPFKRHLPSKVSEYHTIDLWPKAPQVTYIGDIQDMFMVPSEFYDGALLLEVLEHIPNPLQALSEVFRILKPNGVLIASAPHLSRIHDEPYDYFRFTIYGLLELFNRTGFNILEIYSKGGLCSFIGHQLCVIWLSVIWRVPVLKQLVLFMNKYFVRICIKADSYIDRSRRFSMGYVIAARKPQELSV